MAYKEAQPSRQRESGYDYNFVGTPPDRLVCKICQFPCSEAQLTECCGHVYCQSCVEKVKIVADREYSCPMCREVNFKTIAHHEANRTIKELLIYCPNNKEGWGKCSWTGALRDVNSHLKNCKVKCRKCGISLGYHAMRRHLATLSCLCKHCHRKTQCCCLVACPNKCGQDVLKDKIDEHKKVCPSEIVECKYQCGVKLLQCEIEKHYKTSCTHSVEDLQLMFNENLKGIYEEIKNNAIKTAEAKDIIKDDVEMLKQSVADIKQATMDCYEKHENILHCIGCLLLITLVLIGYLTVMLIQMPTKLESVNTDGDELTQQIKHKDHATKLRSHNNVSKINSSKFSWLLKYGSVSKQNHDQIVPVILKMIDFNEKWKNKDPWYSDPFFVSKDGCEMCLRVDASGHTNRRKNTFISVYLYVKDPHDIVEEHDKHCNWPLRGEFFVELLNHNSDSNHQRQNMTVVTDPGFEFADTDLFFSGLGCHSFISHKILNGSRDDYLVNDTLYFRILYDDASNLNVVYQYSYADTYHYYFDVITKYIFTPFSTMVIAGFIIDAIENWDINGGEFTLFILLLFCCMGMLIIGNLLGGLLCFMIFILAAKLTKRFFPDQRDLIFFCGLLGIIAIRMLLVGVLQMPWGLGWGIL